MTRLKTIFSSAVFAIWLCLAVPRAASGPSGKAQLKGELKVTGFPAEPLLAWANCSEGLPEDKLRVNDLAILRAKDESYLLAQTNEGLFFRARAPWRRFSDDNTLTSLLERKKQIEIKLPGDPKPELRDVLYLSKELYSSEERRFYFATGQGVLVSEKLDDNSRSDRKFFNAGLGPPQENRKNVRVRGFVQDPVTKVIYAALENNGEIAGGVYCKATAVVKVRNVGTGFSEAPVLAHQDPQDEISRFEFDPLMPGRYQIVVAHPGTLEVWAESCANLLLRQGDEVRVQLEFQLPPTKEVIRGGAEKTRSGLPLLSPAKTGRIQLRLWDSELKDWKPAGPSRLDDSAGRCAVEDVPRVSHRDLNQVSLMEPETNLTQGSLEEAVSVNGQRAFLSDYSMDGSNYKNNFFGVRLGGRGSIDTEAVREFQVATPNEDATYGRGPAVLGLTRPASVSVQPVQDRIARHRFGGLSPGFAARGLPDIGPTRFSFTGLGDGQCRIRPCPYTFQADFEKRPLIRDLTGFRRDFTNATFPVRNLPEEFDATTLDLQFKPEFAFENHRLTASWQYVRFTGLDLTRLFASDEADSPSGDSNDDRLFFLGLNFASHWGGAWENQARFAYADEQRDTLAAVFDAETSLASPVLGGDATDHYRHFEFGDAVSYLAGDHFLTWGGELIRSRNQREGGLFDAETAELFRHPPPDTVRNWDAAVFFHNRWRVTDRLDLNFGIRWEGQFFPAPSTPPSEAAFASYLGDPDFVSDGTLPDQINQWQPRFGFAWSFNNRSLLQGGAGIFNGRQTMLTQFATLTSAGVDPDAELETAPIEAQPNVMVFSRDYRNPRIYSGGLRYSHQWGGVRAFLSFRWLKGVFLTRFLDVNQSDAPVDELSIGQCTDLTGGRFCLPQNGNSVIYDLPIPPFEDLGEVLVVQSSAKSLYRAVTAGVRKAFLDTGWGPFKGSTLNAYYTYSRDLDDDSSENFLYGRPFNRFRLSQDYAVSDRDVAHRVQVLASSQLKWSEKEWVNRVLPRMASVRFRARSARPASFNPIQAKQGQPVCDENAPTRVVEGVDCGRNHLRLDNAFAALDWRLEWQPLRRLSLSWQMLNTADRQNLLIRQDALRDPVLLRTVDTPIQWRFTVSWRFNGFEF